MLGNGFGFSKHVDESCSGVLGHSRKISDTLSRTQYHGTKSQLTRTHRKNPVPIIQEAAARWNASPLAQSSGVALDELTFLITDLPDRTLAQVLGGVVFIDVDAAGAGWFVDPTPADDLEFANQSRPGVFTADVSGPAYGQWR